LHPLLPFNVMMYVKDLYAYLEKKDECLSQNLIHFVKKTKETRNINLVHMTSLCRHITYVRLDITNAANPRGRHINQIKRYHYSRSANHASWGQRP
jgi:hypothetical protein